MSKNNYIKQELIEISKIDLMESNPRYTFDEEEINFKKVANSEQNQKNALTSLIESEEELSKLLNLIENLIEKGFLITEDVPPFIIRSDLNERFIVVEGNRRLFALKLISKDRSAIEVLQKFTLDDTIANDDDKVNSVKFNKNRKKIFELIEKYDGEINDLYKISVNLFDFKNLNENDFKIASSELIEIIVSRHSYAESSLKKEWSRTKMFFELKARFIFLFNDFISKNESNPIEKTFQKLKKIYRREISTLKQDLFSALYITNIIDIWATKKKLSKKDKEKAIKSIKVSSIELSLSKIKKYKEEKISLRKWLDLKINYDKINKKIDNKTELLIISRQSVNWDDLSDFIMYSYTNNYLNTRGFRICKKNLKTKDEKLVKKYSKIFNLDYEISMKQMTCELEISPLQENLNNILEGIAIVKEKTINAGIFLDEENKINSNAMVFKNFILKSKEIYNEIIKERKHLSEEELIQIKEAFIIPMIKSNLESGIVDEKNIQFKKKINTISKPNNNNFIKLSLYLSLKRLIEYDLEIIDNFDTKEAIEYDFSLFSLSLLTRSVSEMFFVYSGYFEKTLYENDEARVKFPLNPLKIFKYEEKQNGEYNFLDFSFKGAFHSISEIIRKHGNFCDHHSELPKIYSEISGLRFAYNYGINQSETANKIIHRFWSIPLKKQISTKFYSSIGDLDKYIEDSITLIRYFIITSFKWLEEEN